MKGNAFTVAGWIGALLLSALAGVVAFGVTCATTATIDSSINPAPYGIPRYWEVWMVSSFFAGGVAFVIVIAYFARRAAQAGGGDLPVNAKDLDDGTTED